MSQYTVHHLEMDKLDQTALTTVKLIGIQCLYTIGRAFPLLLTLALLPFEAYKE